MVRDVSLSDRSPNAQLTCVGGSFPSSQGGGRWWLARPVSSLFETSTAETERGRPDKRPVPRRRDRSLIHSFRHDCHVQPCQTRLSISIPVTQSLPVKDPAFGSPGFPMRRILTTIRPFPHHAIKPASQWQDSRTMYGAKNSARSQTCDAVPAPLHDSPEPRHQALTRRLSGVRLTP